MKRTALVLLILFAAGLRYAVAQEPSVMLSDKPGWHKIGEVKADFKTENESIEVLGKDRFKSVLLKVTDAPINIEKVQIVYESGETQEIPVASELEQGSETKVIDLKENEELKSVIFAYKTAPNSKEEKAHVELYGLK